MDKQLTYNFFYKTYKQAKCIFNTQRGAVKTFHDIYFLEINDAAACNMDMSGAYLYREKKAKDLEGILNLFKVCYREVFTPWTIPFFDKKFHTNQS